MKKWEKYYYHDGQNATLTCIFNVFAFDKLKSVASYKPNRFMIWNKIYIFCKVVFKSSFFTTSLCKQFYFDILHLSTNGITF